MEPNLQTGERVLASKFSYWFGMPRRGDVVIFKYPVDPKKNYVKRVVGLPGDTVEIRDGVVYVNGGRLTETYKINEAHGSYGPETVKSDKLFVLGDNRDQSNDSRFWGELPIANVQAKAVMLYWPPSRWRLLN
jgi:signal peptidase I